MRNPADSKAQAKLDELMAEMRNMVLDSDIILARYDHEMHISGVVEVDADRYI